MLKRILLSTLAVLSLVPAASANGLPLTDSETVKERFVSNPRPVKDIGDPHVIRNGNEYFAFATGGPIGFNVWRSSDLKTFTKEKAMKKSPWASGDYWAPEVYRVGEKYVMFYTGRWKENGSLRAGVAMSDLPQGPYEDAIGAPLFDFGYAVIDGTLVYDKEGTPYMIYSRDCSENIVGSYHESHLYGVQLAPDLLSTVGEGVPLTTPDTPWELNSGDYRWNEGPFVLKHDGRYYLYYSANGYAQKEYAVGVAVADHPLGPYTKQENNPILNYIEEDGKVLVSGPGHNSFFTVGDELFTSYHTHTYTNAPSGNRQIAIDRAGFHADGTAYINGPTLAPQLRPLSDLGLINHMPFAKADEAALLLADGDTCQSVSSSAYTFTDSEAVFTWDTPVCADMLLIYPAQGAGISGQVIVNDVLTADFALEAGYAPGQSVLLTFEPIEVSSLRLVFSGEAKVGEVMLIGSAQ
ncbi:MAG: glycoside hydrolase family 43 protein [Clostridia bacterium]|nr:glycoside hydrolase family 43 protein [Clostridia bacterium]